MDRKLVRQIDALAGDQFNFQPGRIRGVWLILSGTNSTGVTGALSNTGSVVINRDSRQIVNAKVSSLANMNDIRFGSNIFSSTEASTFLASAYIPFFESDKDDQPFQNALAIVDDAELNIEWVPDGTVDATFDDLSLKVFSELAAYSEKYEYRILRDNQTEGGAVAGKPYQLNKNNVTGLFMEDPDDVVDLVQLEQNGRTVFSPQDWDILTAATMLENQIEASTFDMIRLQCFSNGNLGSAPNRDTVLYLTTSGAGTVEILTTSMHVWNQGQGKGRGRR